MTQKERQERSRREILRAAMEEYGAHGYDAVSMENICARHGISKGMMYHYYSNKDELFLLCVGTIFSQLQKEIESRAPSLVEEETLYAVRDFCLLREDYFQRNPQQKLIFETALLRPPRQLAEAIHTLHRPLYEVNQRFFMRSRTDDAAAGAERRKGHPVSGMRQHLLLAAGRPVSGGNRNAGPGCPFAVPGGGRTFEPDAVWRCPAA